VAAVVARRADGAGVQPDGERCAAYCAE
jgi:hypothetical protein